MPERSIIIKQCQYKTKPVVDVVMIAYNHEKYIAQAIESVLMQKTQYNYRLLIGEGCSTDSTRKIISDYYRKYPDKIELYLWKRNVGASRNAVKLLKQCQGKYIASLEGDDYWTDPQKLEKQISFLEHHSEYIGSVHNVRCVDEQGRLLHRDFGLYPVCETHIYGIEQALRLEQAGQTASLIYRNILKIEEIEELFFHYKGNGDVKINALLGIYGDIYYFRDIMADHRRVFHGDSWTAQSSGKNMLWFSYTARCEIREYLKKYKMVNSKQEDILPYWEESLIKLFFQCNKENIAICWKFLRRK